MSIETLQVRQFSDKISKYAEYLVDNGVDLEKVRFSDNPFITYDYEQNIIITNSSGILFYDGKVKETGKTLILTAESYDLTNVNISEMINNTELGVVIYVEDLVKKYVNGEWVLKMNMIFLDEKMDILNDFDDTWDIKDTDITFDDKVKSIMEYFSENIDDISFIVVNPKMLEFIINNPIYDSVNKTYLGLPIKMNSNLREDIISLCTMDDTFYLKITND